MNFPDPAQIVACERYPIDDPTSERAHALSAKARAEYRETGLCALPGFINDSALTELAVEAMAVVDQAWVSESHHTAWLRDPNEMEDAGAGDPRGEFTRVGSVAADHFGPTSRLRQLYEWPALIEFLSRVLDVPKLYPFADALGSCSVNVFIEGGVHGWHFDEAEFSVTLMLQAPDRGGEFEYVPTSVARRDAPQSVDPILRGDHDAVRQLLFVPGTLLVFAGRETLHRVTAVSGDTPRLVPVLCYAERPGLVNSEAVRTRFWGRTA